MAVKLYWMSISHPSQAARKMLELKGVEYQLVNVLPLGQRVHVRLVGFRGGTVPALKVDGRRIQGTRRIARAVDQLWPAPALFSCSPSSRIYAASSPAADPRLLRGRCFRATRDRFPHSCPRNGCARSLRRSLDP